MTGNYRPDLLAALLGSRICHDLISPLGAIGNGLELLKMQGNANGPEVRLISDSVVNAHARIRLFRLAFGTAELGQTVARREMATILEETFPSRRMELDHDLPDPIDRGDAKLVLLSLLCLESALPTGGRLSVVGDGSRWRMAAAGPELQAEPRLWDALREPSPPAEEEITPDEVQFAILKQSAPHAGRRPEVEIDAEEITLRF